MKHGHLNLRNIIVEKDIVSIPILKIEEGKICGDYQVKKQTNMYHNMVQHTTTTRVIKFFHMDLMGTM